MKTRDYRLSELHNICKNAKNCASCDVRCLCEYLSGNSFSRVEVIDDNGTSFDDLLKLMENNNER